MKKIEYRVLTEDDYDRLYELWISQAMTKRAMNPVDDSRDGITRYIRRNSLTCFGAFEDEKMIGAILSGHDGRRGIIHHLCVQEDHKRQKIASTLVKMAEEGLKKEGIQKIFCIVFSNNDEANSFWEKMDYSLRTNIIYRNKSLNDQIPKRE